jgi:YHS domain-containing protein
MSRNLPFAVALALVVVPTAAIARTAPVYTGLFGNVALSGYDPVAYFTDGRPVKGDARFKIAWQGAEYRFASADHLARFRATPAAFAPQYGGYCAWAVAHGYTASGDPMVWKIVGGRLYLNYNAEVGRKWAANIPGFIKAANAKWPQLLAQ